MSAQECRDFKNGYCRFGNNCRFAHTNNNRAAGGRLASVNKGSLKYQFNEQTIETELKAERPKWILSSFGAAKYEPCLFFGDELSPEELRWKSVQALKAGQPQQYVAEEQRLQQQALITINQALSSLSTSAKLAEKLHDARYPPGSEIGGPRPDSFSEAAVLGQTNATAGPSTGTGFGGGARTTSFGQAGGASGGFGSSAFGQKPAGGAFGSSAFGQSTAPTGPKAFGAPATPTAPKAFGASSNAFGAASTTQPPPGSGFGQSAFGQKPPAAGGFGSSAFGASTTATPAFGSSGFGAKPATVGGAFGAPAAGAFGSKSPGNAFSATPAASPFGGANATLPSTSPFGANATQPASSPFGGANAVIPASSSPFGGVNATQPTSGFGQSAFGQPSQPAAFGSTATSGAFGSAPQTSAFGSASSAKPAFGSTTAPAPGTGFGQSAFGQPSKPAQTSAFGSSSTPASNPFAQPTGAAGAFGGFGQPAATPSQPSSTTATAGSTASPSVSGTAFGFGAAAPKPQAGGAFGSTSAFGQTASAFGSGTPSTGFGFGSSPAGGDPGFEAGVEVPEGWSWDDPWSCMLPTVAGNGEGGKLDDEKVKAFQAVAFQLNAIPVIPPPVELRA